MMSSPLPTLLVCLGYFMFVLVWGPKWMKDRPAYNLKSIIIAYNLFQTIFSIWMFYTVSKFGWFHNYSFVCQPVDYSMDPSALAIVSISWWYYISKFTEFLDTVRKGRDFTWFYTCERAHFKRVFICCCWPPPTQKKNQGVFRFAQEKRSNFLASRHSPRRRAVFRLVRRQIRSWWTRDVLRFPQHVRAYFHVFLLHAGCAGTGFPAVLLVEEIPHETSNDSIRCLFRARVPIVVYWLRLSQSVRVADWHARSGVFPALFQLLQSIVCSCSQRYEGFDISRHFLPEDKAEISLTFGRCCIDSFPHSPTLYSRCSTCRNLNFVAVYFLCKFFFLPLRPTLSSTTSVRTCVHCASYGHDEQLCLFVNVICTFSSWTNNIIVVLIGWSLVNWASWW